LAAEIQLEFDAFIGITPDLNKVILLSHMQQITIEQELTQRLENVDLIVAGGSNTRLFDNDGRIRDGDNDQGDYPQFFTNAGGTQTALGNTDGSYKYIGRPVIEFDEDGNIIPGSYDETISGTFSGPQADNAGNALFNVGGVDVEGNPESAIYLHNAAAGENGPIVRNFTVTDNGDRSGSFTATFTLTNDELNSLAAGDTYINLHTTDFNSGQLRGQIESDGLIDPEIQAIVDVIEEQIIATESNVFGVSDVFLNGNRSGTFAPDDPDGVHT